MNSFETTRNTFIRVHPMVAGVYQYLRPFFFSCPETLKCWAVAGMSVYRSLGVEIQGWTLKNLGGHAMGGERAV